MFSPVDIRESRSLSTRDENPTSAFSGSLNMGREGTKLGLHAPPRKSMRRKVFCSRSTRNTDSYLNLIGIGALGYATLSMALALQMTAPTYSVHIVFQPRRTHTPPCTQGVLASHSHSS